ncbi:phage coat protein [Vibrionales bacterium C3R12]|nr:phage coat protein [Vibrionales bacterium C3R12]
MTKLGKKLVVGAVALSSSSAFAEAFDPSQYFSEINLAAVAAAVVGVGVVILGIAMSEKGITIAKRVIGKA